MRVLRHCAVIVACVAPAATLAEKDGSSSYVGRYNGSSFETAMGMEIRADGSFTWGISVGAYDARAKGSWEEERDGVITLTSDPVPVPPRFSWSGEATVPDGKLIRLVWHRNGEPFQYASVKLTCVNGARFSAQIPREGWSPPPGECDTPKTVQLFETIYDVTSKVYDLQSTFAVAPGATIRFQFHANDMGVLDFTGITGRLEDGILKLQHGRWPMELRKITPRPDQSKAQ